MNKFSYAKLLLGICVLSALSLNASGSLRSLRSAYESTKTLLKKATNKDINRFTIGLGLVSGITSALFSTKRGMDGQTAAALGTSIGTAVMNVSWFFKPAVKWLVRRIVNRGLFRRTERRARDLVTHLEEHDIDPSSLSENDLMFQPNVKKIFAKFVDAQDRSQTNIQKYFQENAIEFDTKMMPKECFRAILFAADPEFYEKHRISIPRGMLFAGPPGTGKTFFYNFLAYSTAAPQVATSASHFLDKWLGGSEENIRSIFGETRAARAKYAQLPAAERKAKNWKRKVIATWAQLNLQYYTLLEQQFPLNQEASIKLQDIQSLLALWDDMISLPARIENEANRAEKNRLQQEYDNKEKLFMSCALSFIRLHVLRDGLENIAEDNVDNAVDEARLEYVINLWRRYIDSRMPEAERNNILPELLRLTATTYDTVKAAAETNDNNFVTLLFIDEFDTLGSRGNGNHEAHTSIINQMLEQMDGAARNKNKRLMVIGATNRLQDLDPGLIRNGRIDYIVPIVKLGADQRRARIQYYMNERGLQPELVSDADMQDMVTRSDGFSNADIKGIFDRSVVVLGDRGGNVLSSDDIRQGFQETYDKWQLAQQAEIEEAARKEREQRDKETLLELKRRKVAALERQAQLAQQKMELRQRLMTVGHGVPIDVQG